MACERPLIASLSEEAGEVVGGAELDSTDPGDERAFAEAILTVRAMLETKKREMGKRART
jgi:hypothetical protein